MAIPSGTITLLFTDIEGSTKLWEAHPEAMQTALARHDALLREAIEANNGYVFKTIGDAFCAAFATAPEALATALTAQLALAQEDWPKPITLKVRMALHTGAVESREGDYFGQQLNRVARLLATGHGGQTLLTQAAQELIRDSLPPHTKLRDLGTHQLKDLARPEQVYQLQYPELPESFPALKSLSTHPNNLPQQVTSFIGREKELVEVQERLAPTRLLTLTGAGGSGKSRLSLQAAADLLERFPDGVFLVELAPLADPNLVVSTVASALGIKEVVGKPILATLTEALKTKTLLLLLDNCEHVLDASAKLANALIRSCPGIKILATSREGLGIAGESTYRVPSLSLPDPKQTQTAESLSHFESVQLFIDRALQTQPSFTVTNANAPALASICFRLDGIPLAIELAAARARSLSVEDIN
uniref:ATP-binding protein n=1 Tax=Armatimonas sp. TaxID=1872638 RepID=UPI00286D5E76